MKKFITTALTATALMIGAAAAHADTLTIAVGQEGRPYELRGKELAKRLKNHETILVNYAGSGDIADALCSGDADIGFLQIDAIERAEKEGCVLKTVGYFGTEYPFLLFPKGSKLNELSDLTNKEGVLVDEVGSGTDLFWQNVRDIEFGPKGNKSSWASAKTVNDFAFLGTSLAAEKKIAAVLLLTTPNNAELKDYLSEGWTLGEFWDKDINDYQFRGESLYPNGHAEIANTGTFFSSNISDDAYEVRSFIVIAEHVAADRDLYRTVARAAKAVETKK